MLIVRKILFYIFASLYLVLCPLIILYAFGYIFTPQMEEGLVKTGLIHLETFPAGASISIANKRYAGQTPSTIRSLLAGKYDIKISLKGYRPWIRQAAVESGKAVAFDKILLIPEKLKTRVLIPETFEDLLPIPKTHFLLLMKSKKIRDFRVFNWKSETAVFLFSAGSPYRDAELVRSFVNQKNPFVLLEVKLREKIKFLWCRLDKEKPLIKDVSLLFPRGEPSEIQWESGEPEYLFAFRSGNLDRLDLEKMVVYPKLLEKIQGFGLHKGKVYALRSSSMICLSFNAKKDQERVVEKGVFLENLFHDKARFKFDFLSHDTLCFFGEKGELFANELPYRFVEQGLKGYQPDDDGKKIVLWKEKELGVLDFEKTARKKEIFERGPEIEWLLDHGNTIEQAYFVYDASHVLYRDQGEVMMAAVGEGKLTAQKLVKLSAKSSVFYSDETGRLYYLEPSAGYFSAVDILPEGMNFSSMLTGLENGNQEAMK